MTSETPAWRRPFLAGDGIRGYGMLAVFLAHVVFAEQTYSGFGWTDMPGRNPAVSFGEYGSYGILSVGHTGLDLFLALSAYLLSRPFMAWAASRGKRPGVGRFVIRRALRILPGYWVVCGLVIAWLVVLRDAPIEWGKALPTLVLGHDYQWGWAVALEQAWSVRVEALFYLLLPLLGAIWWAAGRFGGLAGARAAILLTAAAAIAYPLVESTRPGDVGISGNLWLFAPGLLAALVESCDRTRGWLAARRAPLTLAAGALGLALLLAAMPVSFSVGKSVLEGPETALDAARTQFLVQLPMQAIGCALVMIALLAREWQGARPPVGLGSAAIRWLGARSYSFYLTHYAVIGALLPRVLPDAKGGFGYVGLAVAAFVVTLAMAAVLFRVVELPAMRLAARLTHSRPPGPLSVPGGGPAEASR
ncbi:acyltransferase family protein [Patulibacter defluvii]|uniref:acyltransferase family protein n=1 Tax=Patulibacter defluvii TaxID=3095358 RepID=UPI002A75832B|nr:acyltransferase [Patulibacter sp. DM4]